ncbi:MAG: hypothetical protein BWY66_00642 [bacterium ADurb.Bin374]|nr:MAG: hypothetical protein BWY66_00642 [bacterium ADurb.Bin374]
MPGQQEQRAPEDREKSRVRDGPAVERRAPVLLEPIHATQQGNREIEAARRLSDGDGGVDELRATAQAPVERDRQRYAASHGTRQSCGQNPRRAFLEVQQGDFKSSLHGHTRSDGHVDLPQHVHQLAFPDVKRREETLADKAARTIIRHIVSVHRRLPALGKRIFRATHRPVPGKQHPTGASAGGVISETGASCAKFRSWEPPETRHSVSTG